MCQAFASILFYSMPSILQQEAVYFIVCLTGYSPLHQQGYVGCSLHFREQYSHIVTTRIHNTVYIDPAILIQTPALSTILCFSAPSDTQVPEECGL